MSIPNVLASRYASPEMVSLFDQTNRVKLERRFWIAVLEAQIALGLDVGPEVVADYAAVVDEVDLESIRRREAETKHDVKARIDEFCALAGHQDIHKGLTSRDVTENVEQLLIWQALGLVEERAAALLARHAELALEYVDLATVGRSHNVPAQLTTIGKRFAQYGEELLVAFDRLQQLRSRYALRGIKGPVGSQQDQLDLLGSADSVQALEEMVREYLGVPELLGAVGQVYPRSMDFDVVTTLLQLGSGPANLAISIRLMGGHELVTEGFQDGQVGSSAMPHKMNTRSCERVNGLFSILRGHVTMASSLAGDQWNEGDVSCSVVRRVVIPDAFFTIDGLFETTFAVLGNFGVFPDVIEDEVSRYLPFLGTTKLLMLAVKNGLGREEAHEVIKHHAVETALAVRRGEGDGRILLERLAADESFPASRQDLDRALADRVELTGMIDDQVQSFVDRVQKQVVGRPGVAYRGADIL